MLTMPIARLRRQIQGRAASNDVFKRFVTATASLLRYDLTHLTRAVYQPHCRSLIESMRPEGLDVLEISAGETWKHLPFQSYTEMNFPAFDICQDRLDRQFDLIIADQVFEHLLWPYRAGRNVLAMLRPGGSFLVMTPFLIRIHEGPHDCSRWTALGMRHFFAEVGFPLDHVQAWSWGNVGAVKANLLTWGRVGWRKSLPNSVSHPVSVWALATKQKKTE